MLPIILAGVGGVKQLGVLLHQCLAAARDFPHPLLKSGLDSLPLRLDQDGLFAVEDALFLAVSIHVGVVDADVAEVGRLSISPKSCGRWPARCRRSWWHCWFIAHGALAGDITFGGVLGVIHLSIPPHINLRSVQLLGLGFFQRLYFDGIIIRVEPGRASGPIYVIAESFRT